MFREYRCLWELDSGTIKIGERSLRIICLRLELQPQDAEV